MIRLQDIAEMAGVSRTTVSNVINGNTKRVSQKTIDKITAILKEQNYVPHMGSVMLSGHGSRIIGVVLGFTYAHGMQSLQDPFVGELIGNIRMETEEKGYYVMLIGGEDIQNVVDIASKWNVEGLIILGYNEERYRSLSRKLNKKMILIDAYPEGAYTFQNVGVDDYSGGYQIGEYLYSCGYKKALFIAETDRDSDYYRWMGFKQAMEKKGRFCSRSRYIVVPGEKNTVSGSKIRTASPSVRSAPGWQTASTNCWIRSRRGRTPLSSPAPPLFAATCSAFALLR